MSSFIALLLVCIFIIFLFNPRFYYKKNQILEFYFLIIIASFGGYSLITANNIINFVISLELLSISTYALCGGERNSKFAVEASVKYFLLGVFCSAILMFGFALLYILTGSISFFEIATKLPDLSLTKIAIILVFIGVFFKMALVPFHYWISDIFEGATAPVVLFIATAVKIFMVLVICKLMLNLFGSYLFATQLALLVCIILSLIYANFVALRQDNFKRLLAYSAISHSAFIVMPLLAMNKTENINLRFQALVETNYDIVKPILLYLIMYCTAIFIAFLVIHHLEKNRVGVSIKSLCGLNKRSSVLSLSLGVSLLTLAGLPPAFTGLIGKMVVINLLLASNQLLLAIVAIVFSIIACGYYIPVLVEIFLKDNGEGEDTIIRTPVYLKFVLFILSCVCIGFGFWF